jgi:HTH-type transcriptional regulator / antitoxin HigA
MIKSKIKNDRQYRVTMTQLEELRSGLANARAATDHDALSTAHIGFLEADILALEADVQTFERLRNTQFDPATLEAVDHFGRDLVQARIACHLTQKRLADAIGKPEQVIQRYEATNYESASLTTLQQIATAIRSLFADSNTTKRAS